MYVSNGEKEHLELFIITFQHFFYNYRPYINSHNKSRMICFLLFYLSCIPLIFSSSFSIVGIVLRFDPWLLPTVSSMIVSSLVRIEVSGNGG